MKLRTKLALAITLMYIVILAIWLLGVIFINRLGKEASEVIKDNLQSLDYVQAMQKDLIYIQDLNARFKNSDSLDEKLKLEFKYLDDFDLNLKKERNNITEKGEREAVALLDKNYKNFKNTVAKSTSLHTDSITKELAIDSLSLALNKIYIINRNAISAKSDKATLSAATYQEVIVGIGTLLLIIGLSFIVNFPRYIADPIRQLTESINAVGRRDFTQRLDFPPESEFGKVAKSFNTMAKELEEFEASNLAELLIQNQRIEEIINKADAGIVLLDSDHNIIMSNPIADELLGVKSEDIRHISAQELSNKNDLFKEIVQNLPNGFSEKDKTPLRITFSGEESYFVKELSPIQIWDERTNTNKLAGYVIFLTNITEYKKTDIARTNFIATISHELKTPLSSINLSLKLLLDKRVGALNEEQKKLVNNIYEEERRLLNYVNQLLDYSKLESGKVELKITNVNPITVLQYALEAMKTVINQKNIIISQKVVGNLPEMHADAEKTVWVLTNLISNGVRHSNEGGNLILTIEKTDKEVVFGVEDQGSGIDPKYYDKIFERYVQINKASSPNGSGLGLAIAKDFIEAQGGKIWVNSELGVGSTFKFKLPMA